LRFAPGRRQAAGHRTLFFAEGFRLIAAGVMSGVAGALMLSASCDRSFSK